MDLSNDEDAVTSLLGIRSQLENSVSELTKQQEELRQKISQTREEKAAIQEAKSRELQDIYKAQVELIGIRKEVESYEQYLKGLKSSLSDIGAQIRDQVRVKNFETSAIDMNKQLEGAMVFYSEDSLQMELMKRSNATRERRVEYTRLESEIKDLTRKIENRRREAEQARLEKERLRLEEEERLKVAEENARMMQEPRDHGRRTPSFRGLSDSTLGPDSSKVLAWATPNAISIPETEQTVSGQSRSSPKFDTNLPDISFSQFLKCSMLQPLVQAELKSPLS